MAGQIGLHSPTLEIISDDIQRQTYVILQNISQILLVVHSKLEHVFYLTVFVVDLYFNQHKIQKQILKFFSKMNQEHATWQNPQILFLQVPELPKNAKVEIHPLSTVNTFSQKIKTLTLGKYSLFFFKINVFSLRNL